MRNRVLHIITGLEVGGAEMALLRLIENSIDSPYYHSVVSLTPEGEMRSRFQKAGIELDVFNFRNFRVSELIRLIKYIKRLQPAIVQTWMYHADLFGGLAAYIAGIRKIIWGIRATEIRTERCTPTVIIRKLCSLLSWWIPNYIVCVAEAARQLHIKIGYDKSKMIVVHNGFNIPNIDHIRGNRAEFRAKYNIRENEIAIGSVGRFHSIKDPRNFVEAAAVVMEEYSNVRFLLIGKNMNKENKELLEWIKKTKFLEKFLLLDERSDISNCLAAMDIFCLHSRSEGFPNVVGEAMGVGLPCVVTNVGDSEILVGDSGIIVEKENALALSEGIKCLIKMTSEKREKLGAEARERIQRYFTMQNTRKKFEDLYNCLIAKG